MSRDGTDFGPSVLAPGAADRAGWPHVVQFYEADAFLVDAVARFIGGGLGAGENAVVIATESHRRDLEALLRARGLDVAAARDAGRYLALDAAETLSGIMVGELPDPRLFIEVVGTVIERVGLPQTSVRAFGEMVDLLWADGRREAAIRLEELWRDLAATHAFSLLCAYRIGTFGDDGDARSLLRECEAHSDIASG